jgi:hypothetical protein
MGNYDIFMTIWYTLWPSALFYGHLVPICCGHLLYYPHFGKLYQEKSGKPSTTMLTAQQTLSRFVISFYATIKKNN